MVEQSSAPAISHSEIQRQRTRLETLWAMRATPAGHQGRRGSEWLAEGTERHPRVLRHRPELGLGRSRARIEMRATTTAVCIDRGRAGRAGERPVKQRHRPMSSTVPRRWRSARDHPQEASPPRPASEPDGPAHGGPERSRSGAVRPSLRPGGRSRQHPRSATGSVITTRLHVRREPHGTSLCDWRGWRPSCSVTFGTNPVPGHRG